MEAAVKHLRASGFKLSLPGFHIKLTEILLSQDDRSGALKWLEEINEYAVAMKSLLFEYDYELIKAHLAFSAGYESEGLRKLQKAFTIGRENGYGHSLWFVPNFLVDLCLKALEHGIETDYAKALIRNHRLAHDMPPVHIESWPWPLKVYTLGRFEILRDDKHLALSAKTQKKPLELLKSLISFGGENVMEEQLTDSLWPDADGDLAHRSFNTTLHRLRKLIGIDSALQLRSGRLSLIQKYCWLDTRAFEAICAEIEDASKADGNGKIREGNVIRHLFDKAVRLYTGHFLASDTDLPYTSSTREHLRNRFLGIIEKAGERCCALGQWDGAIEYYSKGIETDNLAELCYQGLIICYQKLGQETKAIEIYNRCKTAISESLGLSPSTKTEELFASLIKKK